MRGFMVERTSGVLQDSPRAVCAPGAGAERVVRAGVLQPIIEFSTLVDLYLGVKFDDRPRDSHRVQVAATRSLKRESGAAGAPHTKRRPGPRGVGWYVLSSIT